MEKYYLISDGKLMLEIITQEDNIGILFDVLMGKNNLSFCVVPLIMVIMKYYCLSSFNQEDLHNI